MTDHAPGPGHRWDADRPGNEPRDDKLGRTDFAERVAKELGGWRKKDSLVVSLNGDWGSGKTTLANLIRYYALEQAKPGERKPSFVKFNPWQWSGQGKVMEAFFDEIGTVFNAGEFRGQKQAETLARFWEGFKVLTVASAELATGLQNSITAIMALLAGTSGVLASSLPNPLVKQVLANLSIGLLALSALCAAYAPLATGLADLFRWRAKQKASLEEARKNLKVELEKLEAPVVVIIDDLDRLTKDEVRQVVQLVKANADFPNLVYLILFQQSIVAGALKDITTESGYDFLKKIIQIELEVPAAPEVEMRQFFNEEINKVLGRAEYKWDKERWSRIFEEIVWPWFETPRDIKRFKGMFDFYYEAHVSDGALNVNPIDLILLEILRMFAPQAYQEVSKAFQKQRNIFIPSLFDDKAARKRFVDGVGALTKIPDMDLATQLLLRGTLIALFPQAEDEEEISNEIRLSWYRDMRVCHGEFFPRYFQLGISRGNVTNSFINKILQPGADATAIEALLRRALKEDTLENLVERLRSVRDDIPVEIFSSFITAFLNLTDDLPEVKTRNFMSHDMELKIAGFMIQLLQRVANLKERTALAQKAILASNAVTGPVMCVSLLSPRKGKEDQERRIDDAVVAEMQKILVPRMWAIALSGRMWSLRRGTYIFYRLSEWSTLEEIRQWLARAHKDSAEALRFLMATLRESHISGGRSSREAYTLLVQEIERFVDLESLAASVEQAKRGPLEEVTLQRLREAIQLKKDGRPYAELYVMSRSSEGALYFDESDAR